MIRTIKDWWFNYWAATPFKYKVVVANIELDELEIGGQCHNWLADQDLYIGEDFQSSWCAVSGDGDHYTFAFKSDRVANHFKTYWRDYLR